MREVTLSDALELLIDHRGKTPKKLGGNFTKSGVPVASALLVKNGRLTLSQARRIPMDLYKQWMPVATRKNDVILTSEAPLGQCALVEDDQPLALGQRVFGLRGRPGILFSKYLYYALQTQIMQSRLRGRSSGTTVLGIRQSELRKVRIPTPPYEQQQDIAEVLGALDDKIAVNERTAETALELAQARYALSPATAQTRIGDIATVFDGPHATPQKTQSGPWFLSISSLQGGVLNLEESAHLTEEDFPRWTKRVQPQEGDVLFSYETRLGEAALMPAGVRACLGRRMGLLRPRSTSVSGTLLLHAYLSREFQEEIRRRTVHGATVDRIPLKEMPSWPISLPAENDRKDLTSTLEALHAKITHTAEENRALTTLRDTLLPQLVTGKLHIKDAERAVEDAV